MTKEEGTKVVREGVAKMGVIRQTEAFWISKRVQRLPGDRKRNGKEQHYKELKTENVKHKVKAIKRGPYVE